MPIYTSIIGKPSSAHTLQEFITMGSTMADKFDYLDFCMTEKVNDVPYVVENTLDDYLYELKESSIEVNLKSTEVDNYKYNPKKLADRLYGSTILYHLILKINDMANVHEFNLKNKKIKLIPPKELQSILSKIYSIEKTAIKYYNTTHKDNIEIKTVRKYRI